MNNFLLTLHITSISLVVGTLFLQSLSVVMAMRLKTPEQAEGARILQRRIHLFIYYPILAVAVLSGLYMAMTTGAFTEGKWLHWKLIFVMVLAGLGLLVGMETRGKKVAKPVALLIHIAIFIVSASVIYLAAVKPF